METNANNGLISPLELMLKWNRFCDKNNREGDCILLNEERTFVEDFDDEQQAMKEILNSDELKRNEGFLVPVYENERYKGMLWVSEEDIGKYIDLDLIKG